MWKSCARCGGIHPAGTSCHNYVRNHSGKHNISREFVFRSSQAWKDMRELIKERDGYCCVWCRHINKELTRDKFVTDGLSVHHIISMRENFDKRLDANNLVTLCARCHAKAEKGEIERKDLLKLVGDVSPGTF